MTARPVRKAVFPVAGLGTRFQPATRAMPTVVDKPPIRYAVDKAMAADKRGDIQLAGAMMRPIGHQPFHGFAFDGQRGDCGDKAGWVRTFAQRLLA